MTAKTYFKKKIENEHWDVSGGYVMDIVDIEDIEDMLMEFAEMKCREQREICAKKATTSVCRGDHFSSYKPYNYINKSSILNAPTPEL